MKKEKISKIYHKPQLSLICPPKMLMQRLPPQIIVKQNTKELFQYMLPLSPQLKTFSNIVKKHLTCSEWNKIQEKQKLNKKQIEIQDQQKILERKTQSFFKRKRSNQHRRMICKNSPYVKNKQDYQRILSNLKPIKGPTDSVVKQIKRHNEQNRKNAQNVLLATKQSFRQKISKYSSRIGLKNNQKIFVMNSKDIHIRQALIKNGWVQNNDQSTTFYHLKWVYTDNITDYKNLQQGQFYNHFKNNQELTNKNLFRKNIYKNLEYLQPNYPATYDLQANQSQNKFQLQYTKYEYYKILDKLNKIIEQNLEIYCKKLQKLKILQQYDQIYITKNRHKQIVRLLQPKILTNLSNSNTNQTNSKHYKQLRQLLYPFCFILQQFIQDDKNNQQKNKNKNNKSYTIGNNIQINNILRNIQNYIIKINLGIIIQEKQLKNKQKNKLKEYQIQVQVQQKLIKKEQFSERLNQKQEDQKIQLEKLNTSKKDLCIQLQNTEPLILKTLSNTPKHVPFNKSFHPSRQKQLLTTILKYDRFLLFFLRFLHKKFKNKFQHNFGIQNWWIIKPVGVSRGTGIKIQSDIYKIMNNKYGKIVQKYIEKPLLLKCGRKFDIRQWVLVRSFLPLQVYIFQKCYCRFSISKYQLENFQSLTTHLTNYSQFKKTYKKSNLNLQQSILSQSDLSTQIDIQTYPGKWLEIKQSIKLQIIKSLKCCQLEIQNNSSCFQVYGFDIILDQQYKPWILQANLSPACQKRGFLQKYLNDMAIGIIDLLEYKDHLYGWERLDLEIIQTNITKDKNQQSQYQNKKTKDLKKNQNTAATLIQKYYRNWKKNINKY